MQGISFSHLDEQREGPLNELIKRLYSEDEGCGKMSDEKIRKTLIYLKNHPDMGSFMMIYSGNELAGYALLVNFWSNEYGGIVVHVDELYITEIYRNKGLAHIFFKHLIQTRYNNCVALFLEVTPNNKRAKKLYKAVGFNETGRSHMILHI